jgi:DNA-binding CsgD family transcriptional regulator
VKEVEPIWELPIAVARYGLPKDIPKMRAAFETRSAVPNSPVTRACLSLFEAFVAQRDGKLPESYRHASDAARRFNELGWYKYVHLAQSVLPKDAKIPLLTVHKYHPFSNLSMLTVRERQIAELVLKGFTNRAIAEKLAIRERTVEAHMTSIMSRLGVRSRYQLADQAGSET